MTGNTIVSCPAARQVLTHRGNLKKWQRDPRFLKMREEHARAPGIVCAHCGKAHGEQRYDRQGNPKLKTVRRKGHPDKIVPDLTVMTINHLCEFLYLSEDLYLTWDPVTMEPCCTVCNGWYKPGYLGLPEPMKNPYSPYIGNTIEQPKNGGKA